MGESPVFQHIGTHFTLFSPLVDWRYVASYLYFMRFMVMVVSFSRSFIYVVKLWVLRFFVCLCSRGAKVGFAIWISYLNHNVAKISLLFSFLFFFFFCRVWEGYTLASFLQFLVPLFHGVYIFSCKYHLIGSMTFDSVIIWFGFIQIGFVCFFPLFFLFCFPKGCWLFGLWFYF